MTPDFLLPGILIPAILLLTWIVPLVVVLTAAAVAVAFIIEGFSTLLTGSAGKLPAFREDADLQWEELGQYMDEMLAETESVRR